MKQENWFLSALIIISIIAYYCLFRKNFNFKETFTTDNTSGESSGGASGVAGNAQGYAASIKAQSIKLQDILLISKYRSDYENAIINMDDYIKNLMLQAALNVNPSDPMDSISKLSTLNNAQTALNAVMKFVDAN